MEKHYIVMRQVAPTNQGVILHYVTTTKPVAGELVYTGEFISRTETWGLNEPVRAEILEPMGDVTSEIFDAQATNSGGDGVVIHAYKSEPARQWLNRRYREDFEARAEKPLHWSAGKKARDAQAGNPQEGRLFVIDGSAGQWLNSGEPMPEDLMWSLGGGGPRENYNKS